MTDNLFDRLADLFRSPGPVNWRLAREIAASAAGAAEPIDPWLEEEYRELFATAVGHLESATPLDVAAASGEPRMVDRRTFAADLPEGLATIAQPLAARLSDSGPGEMMGMLAPALVGMQVGGLAGVFGHEVMGRFDLGLPAASAGPPTVVVPNVEDFAGSHDLDRREVRLWAVLREAAHGAVMAVPWVHAAAVTALHGYVSSLELDAAAMEERMRALQDPETLQRLVDAGGGAAPLLAASGDTGVEDATTLLVVAEGYGEHLVDEVATRLLPGLATLRRTRQDRNRESPATRMLSQMIGLEPGRDERGHRFCAEVARRWGNDAVHRIWESSTSLPRTSDLGDPVGWAARVLL